MAVSQSMRHHQSPREAYFPTSRSTAISKLAHTASEFRGMIVNQNQLKKYLTDQLIVLLWSMRIKFCSFTRENHAQNLRCKDDCYLVTMSLCQSKIVARVKSKLVDPSPRMQSAKSTVAFEPNEGAWIVKWPYRWKSCMPQDSCLGNSNLVNITWACGTLPFFVGGGGGGWLHEKKRKVLTPSWIAKEKIENKPI